MHKAIALGGCIALGSAAASACNKAPSSQPVQKQLPAAQSDALAPDAAKQARDEPARAAVYSPFGAYQPLPAWSEWCGRAPDGQRCASPLTAAVETQTPASRGTVRRHAWHLWAGFVSGLSDASGRNDARTQRTDLHGTRGCWSKFEDGTPACSGFFPIWMSWPNTGEPYVAPAPAAPGGVVTAQEQTTTPAPPPQSGTLRTRRRVAQDARYPDPTRMPTVQTKAPTYDLPPKAISKQCRVPEQDVSKWLATADYDKIDAACDAADAHGLFCRPSPGQQPAVCDGTAFVNEGDVMIATESLSEEGYGDIQRNRLYSSEVLQAMYAQQTRKVSEMIGNKFVSTKHMFWPVKGCRPGAEPGKAGCRVRFGALPPWIPKHFRKYNYATNADYLGYEQWKQVVAIDSCESVDPATPCPRGDTARLALDHVRGARPITTKRPDVYPVRSFVHVQISEQVLQERFTATDRALLDQAMIWAYGDQSEGFEAGDFLVTVAFHIDTKELRSWALQSVWWSPMNDTLEDCPLREPGHCFGQTGGYAATVKRGDARPNPYSGLTEQEIAALDRQVGSTWRDHYLMTDSYGIRYEIDGSPVQVSDYFPKDPPAWATTGPSNQPLPLLPVSANVYIEPVIHPIGTNCQNCHRRAGVPKTSCDEGQYAGGCGRASYQTAQCADLLGDYGYPDADPCMTQPWAWYAAGANHCVPSGGTLCNGQTALPVLNTDWIWLLADNHVKQAPRR